MRVRIISVNDRSAVVEWPAGETLQRAIVPAEMLRRDEVEDGVLAAGIPWGVPWEEVMPTTKGADVTVANALRQYGFWTAQDLRERPSEAVAVIQRALGVYLAALTKAALSYGGER